MGGERKTQGKHLLFLPATGLIFLALLLTGCQMMQRPSVPAQKEQPGKSLPVMSEASGRTEPMSEQEKNAFHALDQAEAFLLMGDCEKAFASLSHAVAGCDYHESAFSNRARQILVNILAHPNITQTDESLAMECLIDLTVSSPDAVYGPASPCWLTALNEILAKKQEIRHLKKTIRDQYQQIQTLLMQIEQLKAVDLELETSKPGDHVP